jgi:CTP:phosphocholine cytidylyltransferase-like protein
MCFSLTWLHGGGENHVSWYCKCFCKIKHDFKLEMEQRRAARYATNHYRNISSITDILDNLEWETLVKKNKNSTCNVFQNHQWPSGYSIIQLPHTRQQQNEIQPLKEDAAVPYKITCFQVQFLS